MPLASLNIEHNEAQNVCNIEHLHKMANQLSLNTIRWTDMQIADPFSNPGIPT